MPTPPALPAPLRAPLRRRSLAAALLLPLAGSVAASSGSTWRVGPGERWQRLADALRQAADGDTIEVLAGTYRGDVAVIQQRRLRIVGIGERPVFEAAGQHAEGKAIWVLRDGDLQVENIAFRGARVPSGNGAGIRFEKGRLQLQGCAFIDNQMGLLSGNDEGSELLINGCEFADAPLNPGSLPHLLYVGRIGRLQLSGSLLRHGRAGHLLKCRARSALIQHNRFDDGPDGEASYEIDLPNGGEVRIEHNTLVQSALTQNTAMLSYGAEGAAWPGSQLLLLHNRFINQHAAGGRFVQVWADKLPPGTPVRSVRNQLLGPGELVLGPNGLSEGDQRGPVPGPQPIPGPQANPMATGRG